ncbi:hypothetical protein IC235_11840 [Hymenobacter sp. BT664]|uniref:Knr4/Smi1-like domain-containing protein n=1 Tax=Hymenobacter montanus TaxID=2771359 RepID=A0A927GJK3_9BACT|nr:SMI1/KNR4 family protein [Hymenobacter montanus]MBD2768578.1 hypothetical protein [Hymenobacter montanus]
MIDSSLPTVLNHLSLYWKERSIFSSFNTVEFIKHFEDENGVKLPEDISCFYSLLDGMPSIYPHDTDEEGFSFKELAMMHIKRGNYKIWDGQEFQTIHVNVLPFCDYMQLSWEYAFVFPWSTDSQYIVCIMPTTDSLTPLCDRLSTFLNHYMDDDDVIYNYKME